MTLDQLITREQHRLLNEKTRLENLLAELPDGTLSFGRNISKGKPYYKWYISENREGRRAQKFYLRREQRALARKLARKSLLLARIFVKTQYCQFLEQTCTSSRYQGTYF